MRQDEYNVIESMTCEDIFVTCIGRVERLDGVMRFWLCAAESDQRGVSHCIVRAKLIIPIAQVVPMARDAIAYSCPIGGIGVRVC